MEDRWLSVDEIAAYLGIKRDTVYNWISEKQMPAHRMGRLWKFRKEEVDEWVKSGGAGDNERGQLSDGRSCLPASRPPSGGDTALGTKGT